MDLYTIIGLAGVAGYVAAYTLLQLGFLDGNDVPYSVANVVAASCVLISLSQDFNLASAITQVVWIVVGITGLLLRIMQRRSNAQQARLVTDQAVDLVAPARTRLTSPSSPFQAVPQPTVSARRRIRPIAAAHR